MFGTACDVVGLQQLADERGAAVVYDAAQAIASRVDGRHVAEYGDASVISLSGTKVVTSGEGALVALADDDLAGRFRQLRSYGMGRDGVSERLGLNAKLSELHAALGRLSLAAIEEQLQRRQALIERYRAALRNRPDIRLQRTPDGQVTTPGFFVIDVGENRDPLREALRSHGIESRPYFPALHLMPRFAGVPRPGPGLPVAERLSSGLLALPLYSELAPSLVDDVCAAVCDALEPLHTVDGK